MELTQLKSNVTFHVCESFEQELEAVTKHYANITIVPYRAKCKYHHIKDPFADIDFPEGDNHIVGGCCIGPINDLPARVHLSIKENCFHMLAPQTLIEHYVKNRGYIVTPGWLKNWQSYVKKLWGFDEDVAREFFSEFCDKIIFLDTLSDLKSQEELKKFSSFVDIPFEIVPIGLGYYQLFIDNILEKKILLDQTESQKFQLRRSLKKVADYSMAFDVLKSLNAQLDEKQIIKKTTELFDILFAPQKIVYLSIEEAKAIDELSSPNLSTHVKRKLLGLEDAYTLEDGGFSLKLSYNKETIGVIKLEEIAFKEYVNEYVNLSLDIVNILCIGIINSRNLIKQQALQIQLLQQEKHASMGEIISMIAHQWRQPLAAINMGVNNILADIELDDINAKTFQEELHRIFKYTQGLSHTIDDFRDFFKPAKAMEGVFLEGLFGNVLKIFAHPLKNDNIKVLTHYKESAKIKTYSREIMQVFSNILKNAHEALMDSTTENKMISIVVDERENKKRVRITNNGKPIPEEMIKNLFDPYFSTKTGLNGTGLGLYMAKTIVVKHLHGSITCHNIKDGVCFEVLLPFE